MNYINWFEIPATDIERASRFYSDVMATQLVQQEFGGAQMAMFQSDNQGDVHGAIIKGDGYVPSDKGSLLYLNGGDDLAIPLARVKAAGGEVLQPKMGIGEHGFIAIFKDTEGNRVAFHSQN